MSTKKIIMMCGIPGSGKSAYAKRLKENEGKAIILSSDDIRAELTAAGESFGNEEVFNILHQRMNEALGEDKTVILDACHTSRKDREHTRRKLRHKCKKYVYICNVPLEECIRRDAARQDKVGVEVVEKFYKNFEIPFREEGWDGIEFVNYNPKEADGTYDWYLDEIYGFDQNSKHHEYNLDVHCYKTFGLMIHLLQSCEHLPTDNQRLSLLYAALFHDYGKLFTQTTDEAGNSHYYNHANVATYRLMSDNRFLKIFEEADERVVLDTLFYINYHMRPFDWKNDKTIDKWKRIFGKTKVKHLQMLHDADVYAAGRVTTCQ